MTLNKSDERCPRCAIGTDSDGDGNCGLCVGVPSLLINYTGKRIRELEVKIQTLHAQLEKQNEAMAALETLKRYLSTANPQR